jgi:rod shape-determining protein MreC
MVDGESRVLKLLKFFITIGILLAILKGLSMIPTHSVHPFLADGLMRVQMVERSMENFSANVRDTFTAVSRRRDIQKEKIIESKTEQAAALLDSAIIAENNLLREKLKFQQQYAKTIIPAAVIARGIDNWFNFITVNKGSADGIRPEMVVINEAGLVGYAAEVFPHSSRVIVILDPQVHLSCMNERTKEIYVLKGAVLHPLEVKYATIHSDIRSGDVLVTSGYSYRYKKGIPVGIVEEVNQPKNKLFKVVDVRPVVNFSKLDIVFFTW